MLEYINTVKNVIVKPLKVLHLPQHIQLEPTTYCNLNCSMCSHSQYIQDPRHLTLPQFQSILAQIHPQKLTLSGFGEPLMNPDLTEMVRLAKSQGCSVNTTTNGTFFTEKRVRDIVTSGLDLVKISIDGAKAETYQRVRGEDRFDLVLDGIQRIRDAKQHLKSKTPFLRFNYVITKDNYQEISDVIRLAERLGVNAVYFQILELVGIQERQEMLVGELQAEELFGHMKQTLQRTRNSPVHTNLPIILRKATSYWKKYQGPQEQSSHEQCIMPWFSAYITVDGYVRPCCAFSQTTGDMGNLFEDPMLKIWNGERYQRFRKAIKKGKRPYAICKNCVPQTLTDIFKSSDILPGFLK